MPWWPLFLLVPILALGGWRLTPWVRRLLLGRQLARRLAQITGVPVLGGVPSPHSGEGVAAAAVQDLQGAVVAELSRLPRAVTGFAPCLVITSVTVQEGRTTLAWQLSRSLAAAGHQVLLIDGDLRRPDLSRRMNLPADTPGLFDHLRGTSDGRPTATAWPNLHVVTAGTHDSPSMDQLPQGWLPTDHLKRWLNHWRRSHALIIMDAPPLTEGLTQDLMLNADAVLVAVQQARAYPEVMGPIVRNLQARRLAVLGLVVLGIRPGTAMFHRQQ